MLEVYSRKQINAKIPDIEKTVADHDHDQYITTSEFNKLTAENFKARFAQADLVTKTDFDSRLRKINTELITNKFEHKVIGDKFKEVETFDLSYFKSKSHFVDNDGTQNYLVLQPVNRCFKRIIDVGSGEYIYFWKSKGLSDEKINSITTCDYTITPELSYVDDKIRVKFNVMRVV